MIAQLAHLVQVTQLILTFLALATPVAVDNTQILVTTDVLTVILATFVWKMQSLPSQTRLEKVVILALKASIVLKEHTLQLPAL